MPSLEVNGNVLRVKRLIESFQAASMMEADYSLMLCTMQWRRPGQYVFIQCRDISHYEWHPFSLTSAPDDNFLQVGPF